MYYKKVGKDSLFNVGTMKQETENYSTEKNPYQTMITNDFEKMSKLTHHKWRNGKYLLML